jgi:arylsulfatase A-like enzyme/alpha-L-fucosidase
MRRKEIPRAEYAELAKDFNPQKFDADEWVAVAKAAGMKYLVVGSKHHEGFAMFDSEVSDFNVVDATPFGRDVIKELEEACKKASLAFGVYYSNSLDWRDGGDGGLKDYGPAKNPRRAPFPNTWDPAPVTFDDYVANKALPQVHELLENYELTQIWFDTPAYIPPKHSMAFYKTVYEANPEILVNSRVGNGFGDIGIPGDNVIPDKASANTWEGIATTNNSWGYKSYDDDWKSPLETLFWLVANVSKGGNFLLNVGPDGDGVIPAESVANLLAVGDWLKVNGDAIYGTEPWKVDHEGPTQIQMKGTKHREESGTELEFESNDFWFTRKGNSVYVIALARPETGQISVQALRGHGVEAIRLLGSSQEVTWTEGAESVDIQLPGFDQDGIGYALEVTLTDADAASRPNVIVVLADDMRIGDTGHEGHPLIDTPNIDRLAADGTVFSNAFATSAACTPSRTTLLTGLYERRHGVNFNSDSALTNEAWARSYPMLLKVAGYYVGYIGKNHTPVGKNDEGVIGYGSGVMDRSFDYWYAGHKHLGFYPKEKKQHAIFNNAAADTQVEIMDEGMENFFTPDEAFQEGLNFLDSRPDDQPFALLLNFNVPHGHSAGSMEQRESDLPLYRTTYRDRLDEIELPDTYIAEADIVTPKIPRAVYNGEYIESYNYVKNPDDLKEREIRTMQTISGIDKLLGKLLDKLEEQGVADNTVIVFTSDHGLLHGEHGLGGKVFLYEPSARVPLIVHDPRQAETSAVAKSNEMVALVDIAPTLLDLAGVPAPRETQGESLVPLMRGDEVEWRKFLFLENNMTIQNYPRIEGVRTERWKYSRYFDKAKDQKYEDMLEASINGEEPIYEELFDLQSDPAETRNLTDDPEYLEILERLRKKNADLVRELRGDEPLDTYYQENKVGKDG